MSVKESEHTWETENLERALLPWWYPIWLLRPQPSVGELTESWVSDTCLASSPRWALIIQASHAFFETFYHEASVMHVIGGWYEILVWRTDCWSCLNDQVKMSLSFLFPFELDSILLLTQDHSLPLLQGENLIFKNQFFFWSSRWPNRSTWV